MGGAALAWLPAQQETARAGEAESWDRVTGVDGSSEFNPLSLLSSTGALT